MKKIYLSLLTLAAFSFTSSAQVDLAIGNLNAGFNYNENTGVIDDIYFTILSNENDGASGFKVGIYFAPLNAQSLEDCFLLESIDAPSISGNSSRDVTDWRIDVNSLSNVPPDGTYRLLVAVDNEDDISENNENNNNLYISEQGNNLKFTASGGPTKVTLLQNNLLAFSCFPNPAVKITTVSFTMKQAGTGSLRIFDITGKEIVNVLADNSSLGEGKNEVAVNIENLPSGIYYFALHTTQGSVTQKFVKQ